MLKNLFKSFFVTVFISMSVGMLLLFSMSKGNNDKVTVQSNMNQKVKRAPNEGDILNILQLIDLNDKKILMGVLIDPLVGKISVNNFDINNKSSYNQKTLGEVYDYGGIRLMLKIVNKDYNKKFNRYILIKNENDLISLLDIIGSVEIQGELYDMVNKFTGIKYQVIHSEDFLSLISCKNEKVITELIREYFKQKILLLNTQMGEEIFNKVINRVDSDISCKDFNKLIDIDLDNLN